MPTFASQSKQLSLEQFHSVTGALSSAIRAALRDASSPQEVLRPLAAMLGSLGVVFFLCRCQHPCSEQGWVASLQCWWPSAWRHGAVRVRRQCSVLWQPSPAAVWRTLTGRPKWVSLPTLHLWCMLGWESVFVCVFVCRWHWPVTVLAAFRSRLWCCS